MLLKLLILAIAGLLAADGFFNSMAGIFGYQDFGDYLTALIMAALATPLVVEVIE